MKTFTFNFVIAWKSGGESRIKVMIQYDESRVEADFSSYRSFLRATCRSFLTKIGKNKIFPFSVVGVAIQRKNRYPYLGESLQVDITGENPALFPLVKKGMQAAYKAETIGGTVHDYSDDVVASVKDFFGAIGDFFGNILASTKTSQEE